MNSSLWTQNLFQNLDTIIGLYTKSLFPPKLKITNPSNSEDYNPDQVVLIKDSMGLYFNAIPVDDNSQYQLYNLLYDPGNGQPIWTAEGQLGLNPEIYSTDPFDYSKQLIPVHEDLKLVKNGTQVIWFKNNLEKHYSIPKIDAYPWNGGDHKFGNTVLYNFYFQPEALKSCLNLLPPLIQDLYQYLYSQTEIVDLLNVNPDLNQYQLTDHVDLKTLKITNGSNPVEASKPEEGSKPVEASKPAEASKPTENSKPTEGSKPVEASKPEEASKLAEASKPGSASKLISSDNFPPMFLDVPSTYQTHIANNQVNSWKWINNGCWLDNILFAMFASYPHFPIFEKYMLNLDVRKMSKIDKAYSKIPDVKYADSYPTAVCSNLGDVNIDLIEEVQMALRQDVANLRSNKFQTCVNLRKILHKCSNLVHHDLMSGTLRDPIVDLYNPLINIFGLDQMISYRTISCYHKEDGSHQIVDNMNYTYLLSLELPDYMIENVKIPISLEALLNQFTLEIIPPSELAKGLTQHAINRKIMKASVLPIQIKRVYQTYDKIKGIPKPQTKNFNRVYVPELLVFGDQMYKLRSMVIRLPQQAHYNSLVQVQTQNNQSKWLYYRNNPGQDQPGGHNIDFYDSYKQALDANPSTLEGCYVIFYEWFKDLKTDPTQAQVEFKYDASCQLLPSVDPNQSVLNPSVVMYHNDIDYDFNNWSEIGALGDSYILPFTYPSDLATSQPDPDIIKAYVTEQKWLKTLTPKKDQKPLTLSQIKPLIYGQTLNQIQANLSKLLTQYDQKPELWTEDLQKQAEKNAQTKFSQALIYNNVNEFVQEQKLLTTKQGNSWTPELQKTAIIAGRLLKLLSNPHLSQILYNLKDSQIIGSNPKESYWEEIIKDHLNYAESLISLETPGKSKLNPFTPSSPKSPPLSPNPSSTPSQHTIISSNTVTPTSPSLPQVKIKSKDKDDSPVIPKYTIKLKPETETKMIQSNQFTDQVKVVQHNISVAKSTMGCLSSLRVTWLDTQKFPLQPKFAVSLGLTPELKCDYKTKFPIGQVFTISYTDINKQTLVPTYPTYQSL